VWCLNCRQAHLAVLVEVLQQLPTAHAQLQLQLIVWLLLLLLLLKEAHAARQR
jgi:hypothetical protein